MIPVSGEDVFRRRRRLALTALFLTLLSACGILFAYRRSVDPLHAQQSYESGVRLLGIARYNEAALAFDRAVGLRPEFADAYLMRGKAYAGESETDQAIADFTRTIALHPGDTRAWVARGAAYLDLKKFSLAFDDADHAVALDRRLAAAYNLRGLAARAMGDSRRALADFDSAVDLAPDEDNYYQRAATYQMLDQHARAIPDLDRVVDLRPDAPWGYLARAESRRAIGDVEGAQADQSRARDIAGR
jgi:tetratricopeptide (TPR) repeat protein